MPRTLIPILALATFATLSACCLVGCEEKEVTTEDVRRAYNEYAMDVRIEPVGEDVIQPCPPDTEYMLIQLLPAHFIRPAGSTYYEITIEHKSFKEEQPFQYKSKPDTLYRMPKGRWVRAWPMTCPCTDAELWEFPWPRSDKIDSVFIPRKE